MSHFQASVPTLPLGALMWGRCECWGLRGPCLWPAYSEEPDHLWFSRHQQEVSHRSPFHADIFRSFSWSVNICGRKKWFFFPPGQEEALRDCHGGLPYDVTSPALLDSRLYPMRKHCSPPLELTQEAGEMVFVPSGWHHQVHNLVGWAYATACACNMARTGQGDTLGPHWSDPEPRVSISPFICLLACPAALLTLNMFLDAFPQREGQAHPSCSHSGQAAL